MRTKVTPVPASMKLERILLDLEQELIHASDQDLAEAAGDLGMNLEMKGSAAFIGLKVPSTLEPEDFFDLAELREGSQPRLPKR